MSSSEYVLRARHGTAFELAAGARFTIINTHGQQVVDTWALNAQDHGEVLSMAHTRSCLDRLSPRAGDLLYSNLRRPMLALEHDTSPGVHDTLMSACDAERYRLLGTSGIHANCCDNFHAALRELDVSMTGIPCPLNLFEHVEIDPHRGLVIRPPVSRAGDTVTLRALFDVVVVLSACPMDIAPTNGADCTPKDVRIVFG